MTAAEAPAGSMTAHQVDEFATTLLDALYALSPYARSGLMPVNLNDKPAAYEKYPQMLFTLLEVERSGRRSDGVAAYDAVESAFTGWRSQVLRKLDYLDISSEAYQRLEGLQQWMRANAASFDRPTLRHLRKSMFGRTYAYLYPRLSLILEFANEGAQHELLDEAVVGGRRLRAVADAAFIAQHFPAHTLVAQQRIADTLGAESVAYYLWAAQIFLLQQQAYFDKVFRTKVGKHDQDKENSK